MFSKGKPKSSRKRINPEYYNDPGRSSPTQSYLDSSLHRLQYIGQQNRHFVERILWLLAFTASVTCAGLFINQLWNSYINSPIVTVFHFEDVHTEDIAFPSITICNMNRLKISKLTEYISNFYNIKDPHNQTQYSEALRPIRDLLHFCKEEVFRKPIREFFPDDYTAENMHRNLSKELRKFASSDKLGTYTHHLTDIAQDCEEMATHCIYEGNETPCGELFRPIFTDFGNCCIFNMIPLSLLIKNFNDGRDATVENQKWKKSNIKFTSEDLVSPSKDIQNSPIFWQTTPGKSFGLSVLLEPNLKDYSSCGTTDSDGFLIGLHSSLAYPEMTDSGLRVQPGMETLVQISPQITIAEKSIKKFPVDKRKCYFDDEVDQIMFHHTKYTQTNCVYECESEVVQHAFQCVPIYNMSKSLNITICDSWGIDLNKYESTLHPLCDHCYPSCTEILYEAQLTALPFTKTDLNICDNKCTNKSRDAALVHFSFGQHSYPARIRKEMYTVIDLISSTGGLLGLCLGFSMLSTLKILYYCIIRLCFIYRRKYNQKGSPGVGVGVGLASSYDNMVQNRMSKLWSKNSRNCKSPVFKLGRRRLAWSVKK